jgi:hypothetical protein
MLYACAFAGFITKVQIFLYCADMEHIMKNGYVKGDIKLKLEIIPTETFC